MEKKKESSKVKEERKGQIIKRAGGKKNEDEVKKATGKIARSEIATKEKLRY